MLNKTEEKAKRQGMTEQLVWKEKTRRQKITPKETGEEAAGRKGKAVRVGWGGQTVTPYTQLITSSSLDTLCRWKPLGLSSGICRVCVEPTGKIKRLSPSWPPRPPSADVIMVMHRTSGNDGELSVMMSGQ